MNNISLEQTRGLSAQAKRALLSQLLEARNPEPVPLSYAQERLWFLDQLMPGSSAYNIASAVRIRGELAVEVLERAVEELVRRHEVLRTTIEVREGKAVQVIHSGVWGEGGSHEFWRGRSGGNRGDEA